GARGAWPVRLRLVELVALAGMAGGSFQEHEISFVAHDEPNGTRASALNFILQPHVGCANECPMRTATTSPAARATSSSRTGRTATRGTSRSSFMATPNTSDDT